MALPWMKDKVRAEGSTSTIFRKPDESTEPKDEQYSGLEEAARSMISALEAKDSKGLAKAFADAFAICEMQPHEEYPQDQVDEEDTE